MVEPGLIESLYRRHYHERVSGRERLRFHNVSRVRDAIEVDGRVEPAVQSMIDGGREVSSADLVVYATGYRSSDPGQLLGDLADVCLRDEDGRLRVQRDYRVATRPDVAAGIYLQGATEHGHGLSSTLLSTMAIRSGEIADSIVGHPIPDAGPAPAWAAHQAP